MKKRGEKLKHSAKKSDDNIQKYYKLLTNVWIILILAGIGTIILFQMGFFTSQESFCSLGPDWTCEIQELQKEYIIYNIYNNQESLMTDIEVKLGNRLAECTNERLGPGQRMRCVSEVTYFGNLDEAISLKYDSEEYGRALIQGRIVAYMETAS